MITITAKDRMFVLVAVPLALLACYLFGIRPSQARKAEQLEASLSELGEPEMLMQQGNLLRQRLAQVEAAVKKLPEAPEEKSSAASMCSSDPAVRLRRVVDVLQEQSVHVVHSEWIDPLDDVKAEPDAAVAALQKAKALERPDCWNLDLES